MHPKSKKRWRFKQRMRLMDIYPIISPIIRKHAGGLKTVLKMNPRQKQKAGEACDRRLRKLENSLNLESPFDA